MRKIVFDIETSNIFDEVGRADPALLDIAVVGIYDSEKDEYTCFEQNELTNLWPILEKADMLIGFNSEHFDLPLLNKYYPGDLRQLRHLDLMQEVKKSLGRRIGLGRIAEGTLGVSKSGHGLDAIKWWRAGEFEKVKRYCLDDVKITKEIYEYALSHKNLKYKDGNDIFEIPIDSSRWEEPQEKALTSSLGF
ncbi:MAG TPA: ribonuclease H-like domain-containing protein [Candidatus Paceibacterota bacterium]|nr:ribonuclease H-like domain-containing protein [Candidatus Paceibacterota bacterium]